MSGRYSWNYRNPQVSQWGYNLGTLTNYYRYHRGTYGQPQPLSSLHKTVNGIEYIGRLVDQRFNAGRYDGFPHWGTTVEWKIVPTPASPPAAPSLAVTNPAPTGLSTQSVVANSGYVQSTDAYVNLPFARSVPVVFQATGLQPFAQLNAYFDGTIVNPDIAACAQIVISGESTPFLGWNSAQNNNAANSLRSMTTTDIEGSVQTQYPGGFWTHDNILSRGETIRAVSGSNIIAAVVVSREVQHVQGSTTPQTVLHVLLMRTYTANLALVSTAVTPFTAGMVITGDLSGATATVVSVTTPTTMTTNSLGNAYGMYLIPAGTVKMGSHNFTVSSGDLTSTATAPYIAGGELDVKTSNSPSSPSTYSTTSEYTSAVTQTVQPTSAIDPIAQTFTVPSQYTSGVFVTSVDLYFAQVGPVEDLPVIVQITDTVNGYPGKNVQPQATGIITPDKITVSADGSIATRVHFQGPVYLQPGTEYALKVLSNSVTYKVYVAQLGEKSLGDASLIVSEQPNSGSFFQSQNNSTWNANQMIDLSFQLNFAQFTTNTGTLRLQNQSMANVPAFLPSNPFKLTTGSTFVKVTFPNHGKQAGTLVQFAGANAAVFNNAFTVNTVIDDNNFSILTATSATTAGATGGNFVTGTQDIRADSATVTVGSGFLYPKNTQVTTTMLATTATTKDSVSVTTSLNTPVTLPTSKYILNDLNEAQYLASNKSMDVYVNLTTTDLNISPLVKLHNFALNAITNFVTPPNSATQNTVADTNVVISALAGITFAATTNIITIPASVDINQLKTGSFITISGTTSNNISTEILYINKLVSPYQVTVAGTLVTESPATTTITENYGFIDEIAPTGGTAESKYISEIVNLANAASGLTIIFDASIVSPATVQLYYRTAYLTGNMTIKDTPWTAVTMSYVNTDYSVFKEQTYNINQLSNFNAAQFKLVMSSTDPSKVPVIQNFRGICLA